MCNKIRALFNNNPNKAITAITIVNKPNSITGIVWLTEANNSSCN